MKYLLIIALIISFPGISTFGFADSHHIAPQDHSSVCLFATSRGVDCPKQSNPIDFLSFHLGALKGFTSATISITITLLISFLLLVLTSIVFNKQTSLILNKSFAQLRGREKFNPPFKDSFISWLSLHENSPQ